MIEYKNILDREIKSNNYQKKIKELLYQFLNEEDFDVKDVSELIASSAFDITMHGTTINDPEKLRIFKRDIRRKVMELTGRLQEKNDPAFTLYGMERHPKTYKIMQSVLQLSQAEARRQGACDDYPLYLALTNALFETMKRNGASFWVQEAMRGYFYDLWDQRGSRSKKDKAV